MSSLYQKIILLFVVFSWYSIFTMDSNFQEELISHSVDLYENTMNLDSYIDQWQDTYDVVVVEKDMETGDIAITCFVNEADYYEAIGGNNISNDCPTDTNVDDSKQAQQDFALNSYQDNLAYESSQPRNEQYSLQGNALDLHQNNQLFLPNEKTFYSPYNDPINTLQEKMQSPTYMKTLDVHKEIFKEQLNERWVTGKQPLRDKIAFINAIKDGSVIKTLETIKNGTLKDAIKAFDKLINIYPWKDKISYLVDGHTYNEKMFIDIIGIDVMKVAESTLIGRLDYLKSQGITPSSVTNHRHYTLRKMQLKGDKLGLKQLQNQLISTVKRDPNHLHARVILVSTESLLSDPLTQILDNIKNADIVTARKELGAFHMQILRHIEKQNFKNMAEARADMIEREGVDLLEVSNKCFESRSDYQSYKESIAPQKSDVSQNTNNTNSNKQDASGADNFYNEPINNAPVNSKSNRNIPEGIDPTFAEKSAKASSIKIGTIGNTPKKQNTNNTSQARKNARTSARILNPTARRERAYVLNPDVWARLQSYGINPEQFTYCVGNEVQHQIHSECVSIFNETTHIPSNTSTQPLIDITIACAFASNVSSQQNNTEQAFSLTDCAWAAVDCAKAICDKGIDLTGKAAIDITNGVIKGLKSAVENNVNMVLDPVGTMSNIGSTFCHLAYCFGKFMEPITIHDGDIEVTPELIAKVNTEWKENMQSIIDAAKEITLEGSVAFITEFIASPKITKLGLGALSHYSKTPVAQLTKIIKETKDKIGEKMPKSFSSIRKTITDTLSHLVEEEAIAMTPDGTKVIVSNTSKKADELHNAMGKHGNNHNKKPTFNDIKEEVSKKSKEANLSKKIIKPGPNGVYEDAAYHHKNSNGLKSPAPTDGQHALDNSFSISNTTTRRVSLSHGEFVVLDQTSLGKFHGHICEWNDLTKAMKDALIDNGLVKNNGKII